jgi:hypothetical protein
MSTMRWLVGTMPRSWRIALLRELAWPEFNVTREWLVPDPAAPRGFRITQLPLEECLSAEGMARAMLCLADDARRAM